MKWHKKVLTKYRREIIAGAVFSITFSLALLIWQFAMGKTFVWQTISPFSAPPLVYELYSALVFVTFGAFLYWIKFYRFLHFIFVKILGDWDLYKLAKAIIWLVLIGLMFWLIREIVNLLNATVSFFYNVINFLLYLSPPLGMGLIVAIVAYLLLNKDRLPGRR